ncbi:hypothetical protein ACFL96_03305 [Thermoproteota archaeon]
MKKRKKEVKETAFRMSLDDAIELVLFIIFLSAVLGAVFKEKFVYVMFGIIIVAVIIEMIRYRKDKKIMNNKLDKRIIEFKEDKAKKIMIERIKKTAK